MADMQSRIDLYSRTISDAVVSEFDAEPDPEKRFRKYALTITNSEQAAIEALINEAETPSDGPMPVVTVRLDPDIVEHFNRTGGDLQRRVNDALRALMN